MTDPTIETDDPGAPSDEGGTDSEAYEFLRNTLGPQQLGTPGRGRGFELLLIEKGRAMHRVNQRIVSVSTGDMVFLRPSDLSALSVVSNEGCRSIRFRFGRETADHLVARYGHELDGRFFWATSEAPVQFHLAGAQLERAVNTTLTMQTTLKSRLRLEHFLLTLMTFVLDEVATIDQAAPAWLISACLAAKQPDVFRRGGAGFVEAAGRSKEHVSRQTRRFLGTTPTQFVNRIRIQHAAMLLRQGNLTLEEIAEDCGFENLSYFFFASSACSMDARPATTGNVTRFLISLGRNEFLRVARSAAAFDCGVSIAYPSIPIRTRSPSSLTG